MNASRSSGSSAGSTSHEPYRHEDSSSTPLQPHLDSGNWQTGAKSAAEDVRETASSLASSVKEAASSTTRAVREQASEFASDVGHELGKTAEEQKARGVEAIQGFVRAVNCAAHELEGQSPRVASYVRDAAGKVEDLSNNIANRDVNDLVKNVSELARSQPALFFGGAVAAGFALSRFLKSSAKSQRPAGQGVRQASSSSSHRSGDASVGGSSAPAGWPTS